MKTIYLNQLFELPIPADMPSCQIYEVCFSTVNANQQKQAIKRLQFLDAAYKLVREKPRFLKHAVRYMRIIGFRRTWAKIKSNVSIRKKNLDAGVTSFTVRDTSGRLIAGYRTKYLTYSDFVALHPQQIALVPKGLDGRTAALVYHYALALEAQKRLKNTKQKIAICGTSIACQILYEKLRQEGIHEVTLVDPFSLNSFESIHRLQTEGYFLIINQAKWVKQLNQFERNQLFIYDVDGDLLSEELWSENQGRWIGLPHFNLRNLDIHSQLPLELPVYLDHGGLKAALEDMLQSGWQMSFPHTELDLHTVLPGTAIKYSVPTFIFNSAISSDRVKNIRWKEGETISDHNKLRVGFIGLGSWATGTIIPFLLRDPRVQLTMIAERDPARLVEAAKLFNPTMITSDPYELIHSADIDAVFITTSHDTHAEYAIEGLRSGKKVFVEKPPVLDVEQLERLVIALDNTSFLAVGYNRPHTEITPLLKKELICSGPVTFSAIIREKSIPPTHYYYWPHQGSRVTSNGCHWIDYSYYLLQPRQPVSIQVLTAYCENTQDNNTIVIRYEDGSLVSLTFSNRGEDLIQAYEQITIQSGKFQYFIDDFRSVHHFYEGLKKQVWSGKADRGWESEMRAVIDGMLTNSPPRTYEDIITSAFLVTEARASYESEDELRFIDNQKLERLLSSIQNRNQLIAER